MERTQALKTLRLDAAADGRTVESAYWNLVRRAQERAEKDPTAHEEIQSLNDAYGALAPEAHRSNERPRSQGGVASSGIPALDAFADWVSAEALRTRMRWPNRNPEIALVGGAVLVLMLVAIGAGGSLIATFAAAVVAFVAIWAPWRKAP